MQNPHVLSSGGAFSVPKVNYSKDTQDFVKLLMKEAHLTNTQQRGFAHILRSGEPLPTNSHEMMRQRFHMKRRAMCHQLGIDMPEPSRSSAMRRRRSLPTSGRRSLQQIVASGAYDPTPLPPFVHSAKNKKEDEIARLQHKMAYGSDKPLEKELAKGRIQNPVSQVGPDNDKQSRFEELIDEIADRIEFLNSMHEIGRDKTYRSMMEFQIREKLTELEKNYPPHDVREVVEHFGLEKFMTRTVMP